VTTSQPRLQVSLPYPAADFTCDTLPLYRVSRNRHSFEWPFQWSHPVAELGTEGILRFLPPPASIELPGLVLVFDLKVMAVSAVARLLVVIGCCQSANTFLLSRFPPTKLEARGTACDYSWQWRCIRIAPARTTFITNEAVVPFRLSDSGSELSWDFSPGPTAPPTLPSPLTLTRKPCQKFPPGLGLSWLSFSRSAFLGQQSGRFTDTRIMANDPAACFSASRLPTRAALSESIN